MVADFQACSLASSRFESIKNVTVESFKSMVLRTCDCWPVYESNSYMPRKAQLALLSISHSSQIGMLVVSSWLQGNEFENGKNTRVSKHTFDYQHQRTTFLVKSSQIFLLYSNGWESTGSHGSSRDSTPDDASCMHDLGAPRPLSGPQPNLGLV